MIVKMDKTVLEVIQELEDISDKLDQISSKLKTIDSESLTKFREYINLAAQRSANKATQLVKRRNLNTGKYE
jgi:hypothetical protein